MKVKSICWDIPMGILCMAFASVVTTVVVSILTRDVLMTGLPMIIAIPLCVIALVLIGNQVDAARYDVSKALWAKFIGAFVAILMLFIAWVFASFITGSSWLLLAAVITGAIIFNGFLIWIAAPPR